MTCHHGVCLEPSEAPAGQGLVGGGGIVQTLAVPQVREGSNMGLPSPLDGATGPLAAPLLWALVAQGPSEATQGQAKPTIVHLGHLRWKLSGLSGNHGK